MGFPVGEGVVQSLFPRVDAREEIFQAFQAKDLELFPAQDLVGLEVGADHHAIPVGEQGLVHKGCLPLCPCLDQAGVPTRDEGLDLTDRKGKVPGDLLRCGRHPKDVSSGSLPHVSLLIDGVISYEDLRLFL